VSLDEDAFRIERHAPSAEQRHIDLGADHPLAAVATITVKPSGETEIVGVDRRVLRDNVPRMPGAWAVASAVFDVATSTLRLVLDDNIEFVVEVGTVMTSVDRRSSTWTRITGSTSREC
jgi:predicted short-subunit dehydrogenase-like oxidoreductase (DUF2520 family)